MSKKHIISLAIVSFALILVISIVHFNRQPKIFCNQSYRARVEEDLKTRRDFLDNPLLFSAVDESSSSVEKDALMFLYAYMPIGDIAEYPSKLFSDGVKLALKTKKEMSWGRGIPIEIFRHFVLPIRVNNESLDTSRTFFYNELKERVSHLSMYNAVIEINRWCRERVIYTPSDERTSSPLATHNTAYGRCGEESVYTVAALRAVGIPARQVYTPRWAHTDDNHAWVEVWVDGKWYYLGACEPEPRLNIAWFSATAQRGLLMHSRVFGYYNGEEEIIERTAAHTEINVTANYAPVTKVIVKVVERNGERVEGADLHFKIYNYAELYSAISTKTDEYGVASATLGRGDVVVWAHKDDKFGFAKTDLDTLTTNLDTLTIILDKTYGYAFSVDLDIVPPPETNVNTEATPLEIAENNRRITLCDSIRGAYLSTFPDSTYIANVIGRLKEKNLSQSNKLLIAKVLISSRGNYKEIAEYLEWLAEQNFQMGLALLQMVSEKDLRDTPFNIMASHIKTFFANYLSSSQSQVGQSQVGNSFVDNSVNHLFKKQNLKYLLNPRIGNELLTNWREYLTQEFTGQGFENNPQAILSFCKQIKNAEHYNPQRIPISPIAVHRLMAGDQKSAETLFIALCRTFGIPARFEETTGKAQYYYNNTWIDKNQDEQKMEQSSKGFLKVGYKGKNIDDPKFDTHFTIAKIENGIIKTLKFRDKEGYEGTSSFKSVLSKPIELSEGYYLMTGGTRMATGKVLARLVFFNVSPGETTDIELIMRQDSQDLMVIGALNPQATFLNENRQKEEAIVECTGRGFFVLMFLRANHEPSTHAIRDVFSHSQDLKKWGRPVVMLYSNGNQSDNKGYLPQEIESLPQNFIKGIDPENAIQREVIKSLKLSPTAELPLIIIADTFGRIVWYSHGYQIGTGTHLIAAIKKLSENQARFNNESIKS